VVRAAALLLGAALALGGCASGSPAPPPQVPDSVTADPTVLPAGSTDLPLLAQTYYSPVDFVPPLALTPVAGWHSTHRGDDAFDLTLPGSRLVVSFVTPDGDTVAGTLAALRAKAGARARPLTGSLAGERAAGFTVTGGTGTLLRSPSGTLSVVLAAGQTVRVLGIDLDQTPLLVVTVSADEPTALARAEQLLASVTRG
jgi:hypothetical protein